jgi:hypothetical protein
MNACRIFVEKTEGMRLLRIPRYGWANNIKMNLRDIRGGCVD